jgi:hypothetical protein
MEGSYLSRYGVSLDEMPALGRKGTEALILSRRNAVLASKKLDIEQYGWLVTQWNEKPRVYRMRVTEHCHAKGHAWRKGPFADVCIRCCATGESYHAE